MRLPRPLHPGAWWLWAVGLATAASRTTNPILLALIVAVAAYVVAARRTEAPWARAFRYYLYAGLFVVTLRVGFRVLLGHGYGDHVLFTFPTLPLPDWAAAVRIGGPVTAESVLAGFYDGLRLATMLVCLGAANALADPKRLLRSVPRALNDVGAAVVVAVSFAPQLVESIGRVRRARRLRGVPRDRSGAVRSIAIPVLEDAMSRSLALAASMESRGYGHSGGTGAGRERTGRVLMVIGLAGVCLGMYGLLDATAPPPLGLPTLLLGAAVATTGLAAAGSSVARSTYRPDPWVVPEWLVTASGLVAAGAVIATAAVDPSSVHPSLAPLSWPVTPVIATVGVLVAALPAWLAPPVTLPSPRSPTPAVSRVAST